MSMSQQLEGLAQRAGDEQGIWRAIHEAASIAQLQPAELDQLRSWAGEEMRERPFRCFDPDDRFTVRASFKSAIAIAADRVRKGDVLG